MGTNLAWVLEGGLQEARRIMCVYKCYNMHLYTCYNTVAAALALQPNLWVRKGKMVQELLNAEKASNCSSTQIWAWTLQFVSAARTVHASHKPEPCSALRGTSSANHRHASQVG